MRSVAACLSLVALAYLLVFPMVVGAALLLAR